MTRATPELIAALDPLLDQALELGPDERVTLLAELRERQPELAMELERLLAAEGELDRSGFLAREARADIAPASGLAGMRLGA